jgi:magnesium chelatase family protein
LNVVGLPEGAVKESKVRVASALKNSGFVLPQKRVTVNLAPADIRKEGAAFELPIGLGLLVSAKLLPPEPLDRYLFGGELSLDGAVRPIRGVLPLALAARDGGFKGVIVPTANAAEAALVDAIEVIPVGHIREAVAHLKGEAVLKPYDRLEAVAAPGRADGRVLDMIEVRGQADVKDALEIAAAGGHNVIMCGPPGSGKTMLARRLPSILPPLQMEEALEVTKIYSVLGLLAEGQALMQQRPFRAPHHTISDAGLVGGGSLARPGEISMAHRGVLFLDEIPEFRKHVLEVLRQPLEEGVVRLARAAQKVAYPCQVMLVAAMNPCPCGWWRSGIRPCNCGTIRRREYQNRVSGPVLDRLDLTLETRAVAAKYFAALADPTERSSAWYRDRVIEARNRQLARFKGEPGMFCNAQMTGRHLYQHCRLSPAGQYKLQDAIGRHGLSARAHDRILKVARSRADLEGHESISDQDIALAVEARVIDRGEWGMDASEHAESHNDAGQQRLLNGGNTK